MKSSFLKPNLTESTTVIDGTTGEILEQSIKSFKYLANTKEDFFIAYTQLLSIFYTQLGLPEIKVYAYMLDNYNFNSPIGININIKKEMSGKIGLAVGTIDNALGELVQKRLIYSTSRGVYKLNPRYAYKGSTKDRNSLLRVILELECPDC